jgi:hypothetical protein
MPDDDSIIKKLEDGIKQTVRAVEDFADKVAAPQDPVVIVPDDDAPGTRPPLGKGG